MSVHNTKACEDCKEIRRTGMDIMTTGFDPKNACRAAFLSSHKMREDAA